MNGLFVYLRMYHGEVEDELDEYRIIIMDSYHVALSEKPNQRQHCKSLHKDIHAHTHKRGRSKTKKKTKKTPFKLLLMTFELLKGMEEELKG